MNLLQTIPYAADYFTFTAEAKEAHAHAVKLGFCNDSEEAILHIVRDQEVVSYSSEHGTVTFDYNDFELDLENL